MLSNDGSSHFPVSSFQFLMAGTYGDGQTLLPSSRARSESDSNVPGRSNWKLATG